MRTSSSDENGSTKRFGRSLYRAAGTSDGDAIFMPGQHPFRVTILNVRGKTVFILVGSLVLSPDRFQTFLPAPDRLLHALQFPAGP